MIPEYPRFKEIELDDREAFAERFKASGPTISEESFANLYLFAEAHSYMVSGWGDLLLVAGEGYDKKTYGLAPVGTGEVIEGARLLLKHLGEERGETVLFPVSEKNAGKFFAGEGWSIVEDRDNADYIYLREELATLPGKRFHKKKNRLNKFLREHPGELCYEALGDEHVAECIAIAEGWCEGRCSAERPSSFLETEAAIKALTLRRELGLTGGVIIVGGRVGAFAMGEELNDETFVVHFEKAMVGQEGLAQLINRDFCLNLPSRYTYVNREQDLGDPGLRQAKEGYNPAFLSRKFKLTPRF